MPAPWPHARAGRARRSAGPPVTRKSRHGATKARSSRVTQGWAFRDLAPHLWDEFRQGAVQSVAGTAREKDGVPYFYRAHDLEHIVPLLKVAAEDASTEVATALFSHLALNWPHLERFAKVIEETEEISEGGRTKAITLFSQMLGTLLLSRAVADIDPALADEILDEGRQHSEYHTDTISTSLYRLGLPTPQRYSSRSSTTRSDHS